MFVFCFQFLFFFSMFIFVLVNYELQIQHEGCPVMEPWLCCYKYPSGQLYRASSSQQQSFHCMLKSNFESNAQHRLSSEPLSYAYAYFTRLFEGKKSFSVLLCCVHFSCFPNHGAQVGWWKKFDVM